MYRMLQFLLILAAGLNGNCLSGFWEANYHDDDLDIEGGFDLKDESRDISDRRSDVFEDCAPEVGIEGDVADSSNDSSDTTSDIGAICSATEPQEILLAFEQDDDIEINELAVVEEVDDTMIMLQPYNIQHKIVLDYSVPSGIPFERSDIVRLYANIDTVAQQTEIILVNFEKNVEMHYYSSIFNLPFNNVCIPFPTNCANFFYPTYRANITSKIDEDMHFATAINQGDREVFRDMYKLVDLYVGEIYGTIGEISCDIKPFFAEYLFIIRYSPGM